MLRLASPRPQVAAGAPAGIGPVAPCYARHAPERTLLYALVQAHYPDFLARLEAEDRCVPAYVREEFEGYLRCGVLEHGFLRVVCGQCHAERLVASPARSAASVRAAARGAWRRVRGIWWRRCSVRGRCGSGC